jgi:hypothetical protein
MTGPPVGATLLSIVTQADGARASCFGRAGKNLTRAEPAKTH